MKLHVCMALCLAIVATKQAVGGVLISQLDVRNIVEIDGTGYFYGHYYQSNPIAPLSHVVASGAGDFHSTTEVNYQQSLTQQVLSQDFDFVRSGTLYDRASSEGYVNFIAVTDMNFSLSASLTNSAGIGSFEVYILDITDWRGTTVYSASTSSATPSVSALGSGFLIAGHEYEIGNAVISEAFFDTGNGAVGDNGAVATGNITFLFEEANVMVPEPVSIVVWGSGLIGVVVCRRLRRSRN